MFHCKVRPGSIWRRNQHSTPLSWQSQTPDTDGNLVFSSITPANNRKHVEEFAVKGINFTKSCIWYQEIYLWMILLRHSKEKHTTKHWCLLGIQSQINYIWAFWIYWISISFIQVPIHTKNVCVMLVKADSLVLGRILILEDFGKLALHSVLMSKVICVCRSGNFSLLSPEVILLSWT